MAPQVNFGFIFNLAAVMQLTGIYLWYFSNKDLKLYLETLHADRADLSQGEVERVVH